MTLTAELPLFGSAALLAIVAVLVSIPPRRVRWRTPLAVLCALGAAIVPLAMYPFIASESTSGTALWRWSAVGGPTIEASYRFDGIGAIGVAIGSAYASAGLLAASRAAGRHASLPALILANGLVFIALAVTDDLVAATVVLGALAALTTFTTLVVAPAPAAARLAAYFAVGTQGFVLAALLASRLGAGSFAFTTISPASVSSGVLLAAAAGAALFAGLYPFVPWGFTRARGIAAEREPLRGLLAMPAGVGASLVLLRLVGATRAETGQLPMPTLDLVLRGACGIAIALAIVVLVARRGALPVRPLVVAGGTLFALMSYPLLHLSHVVLASVLLTILYAAAVSLAQEEHWEVVRFDIAISVMWIGIAVGTPVALAAALVLLVGDGLSAIGESVWMAPHHGFIALMAGATVSVGAVLALGLGVLMSSDPATMVLASAACLLVLGLQLVHVARRLGIALVPTDLDVTSAVVALLAVVALAALCATPLYDGIGRTLTRPFGPTIASAPTVVPTLAVFATLFVVVARLARALLPDTAPVARRLHAAVALADPIPAGTTVFRILDAAATRTTATFALFEQRAGVWLATGLIVALLVWSVR